MDVCNTLLAATKHESIGTKGEQLRRAWEDVVELNVYISFLSWAFSQVAYVILREEEYHVRSLGGCLIIELYRT
jgi:hypothetical protein